MALTFSRFFVEAAGNTILAANYNGEFDSILTNTAVGTIDVDSLSDNVTAFQTTEDPGEVGTESLPTTVLGELRRYRNVLKEIIGKTHWYETPSTDLETINIPTGTIVAFYDFGSGGPGGTALTFDSTRWAYCNGSTTTLNGAGSFTLPDLSNRYLVGFGNEAGMDMASAPWSTAAVGNLSHLINLSHSHTVNSHSHTGLTGSTNLSTVSAGSHNHTSETSGMGNGTADGIGTYSVLDNGTWVNSVTSGSGPHLSVTNDSNTPEGRHNHEISSDGNHSHSINPDPHNHTVSAESPGTSVAFPSTLTIQPRSIRVRFIMKIK